MTEIRCVGCGNIIGGSDVDIKGGFAYTCACGATLFTFDGKLGMPSSLMAYLAYKIHGDSSPFGVVKSIPHLEYYIGYSDYMDDIKRDAITALKNLGSISKEECQDINCKKETERQMSNLTEAISEKDDYWRNLPDEMLASHFHIPIIQVRKIKSANNILPI